VGAGAVVTGAVVLGGGVVFTVVDVAGAVVTTGAVVVGATVVVAAVPQPERTRTTSSRHPITQKTDFFIVIHL